jgi:hypothetical protein
MTRTCIVLSAVPRAEEESQTYVLPNPDFEEKSLARSDGGEEKSEA